MKHTNENVITHMHYTHRRSIYISASRSFSLDWLRNYVFPFSGQFLRKATGTVLASFPFARCSTYFKKTKNKKNHQMCKSKHLHVRLTRRHATQLLFGFIVTFLENGQYEVAAYMYFTSTIITILHIL